MNPTASKKFLRLLLALSFGLSALFVLLARLYTVSCTDIVLMYTALPEVLEILVNTLECAIFAIAYAILIWIAYRKPAEGLRKYVVVYACSVLFKYLANYLVTWLTDTGMSAQYLLENLSYILIYTAIELLQAALVLIVIVRTMKGYHAFIARQMRIAANLPDVTVDARSYVFPFTKLLTLQNPLQKCALAGGAVVALLKMISRLIYDISYGMPTSVADGLWIVVYYLLDLFVGFAVCLLITYLLMTFDSREQKALQNA